MKAIDVDWSDDIVHQYRFVVWVDSHEWKEMYSLAIRVGQYRKMRALSRVMARTVMMRNVASPSLRMTRNDIGEFVMVEIMSKKLDAERK